MPVNPPSPDIDPSIAHLDWHICQCEMQTHPNGHCTTEATHRIQTHRLDHCTATDPQLDEDGNQTLELCPGCYETIRQVATDYVSRLTAYGRPHCLGCGAPITCVKHIIREVTKL